MSIRDVLLLSLLQGATEFLPVSSSGHLVLMQRLLGLKDVPLFFDLILHLGTALAAGIVFSRTIFHIISDPFVYIARKERRTTILKHGNVRFLLFILLSLAVTGVLGLLLMDKISQFFYKPQWVPVFLTVTGMVLLATKFIPIKNKEIFQISFAQPLVIGASQVAGGLPGISRSGITVSAGLFMGMSRRFSASFSFILAIPTIAGASIFEFIRECYASGGVNAFFINSPFLILCIIGFGVSTLSGYVALRLLLPLLERGRWHLFSYYCFAIALAGFFGVVK
ncbi:MAG: undecaprenyl-diphosphate phosphatase [Spirochaetota bacterium]